MDSTVTTMGLDVKADDESCVLASMGGSSSGGNHRRCCHFVSHSAVDVQPQQIIALLGETVGPGAGGAKMTEDD